MDLAKSSRAKVNQAPRLSVHGFSMIRNEADIVDLAIKQACTLFDMFTFVDIQSTDGTKRALLAAASAHKKITVLSCKTQERYQASMMNCLARSALALGADWMFFLDADEFLPLENRGELEVYLERFAGDVMSMPWINLIPKTYGDFAKFDAQKEFRWSGRVSSFSKVAVSKHYYLCNPEAMISEGNHAIYPGEHARPSPSIVGLPLLHIPVRSGERLRYKLSNGIRLLQSKHNATQTEGQHARTMTSVMGDSTTPSLLLNGLAADYGRSNVVPKQIDPVARGWPIQLLPGYLRSNAEPRRLISLSLNQTIASDWLVKWTTNAFIKNTQVQAIKKGPELKIVPQPLNGNGTSRFGQFEKLAPIVSSTLSPMNNKSIPELLTETLAASMIPPKFSTMSAWSELVPVLFAIFATTRPRRFVELGVHNGMSFFAGCQASQALGLGTECIAIDSWIGDSHSSFHNSKIFQNFKTNLSQLHPSALYIQSMFSQAVDCFDNGSIDLIHIDGFHTYDAVKNDFESWIKKMSDKGIMIFHDIEVRERDFGVWKLWKELQARYPNISFRHSHGLGLIYVGKRKDRVAEIFRWFMKNPAYLAAVQKYFELVGANAVKRKVKIDDTGFGNENGDASPGPKGRLVGFFGAGNAKPHLLRRQPISLIVRIKLILRTEGVGLRRYQAVNKSPFFDRVYYLALNRDVREQGIDPVIHYLKFGSKERRDPSGRFSEANYFSLYPDAEQSGMAALEHYELFGRAEGRAEYLLEKLEWESTDRPDGVCSHG